MRARRRLGARTPRAPGTTAKKKYTYSYVHSTSWFVNVSSFVVVVETSKPSLACRVTRRHTALTFGVLSPTTRIAACTSTSISTRVPAQTLANPIARRPNFSEPHSETRVLEYPFRAHFTHTKGYSRVLGGGRAWMVLLPLGGVFAFSHTHWNGHTMPFACSVSLCSTFTPLCTTIPAAAAEAVFRQVQLALQGHPRWCKFTFQLQRPVPARRVSNAQKSRRASKGAGASGCVSYDPDGRDVLEWYPPGLQVLSSTVLWVQHSAAEVHMYMASPVWVRRWPPPPAQVTEQAVPTPQ